MDDVKYYTQKSVSEMLDLSTVTLNKYISELTQDQKKGKFNFKNQPNNLGIKLLKQIRDEKAGYSIDTGSRDREIIETLKKELEKEKEANRQKDEKILKLTEEKAKMASDYAEKFSNFLNQQQILQGQLQNIIDSDSSKKIISNSGKVEKKEEEKIGFFERLFGKK